jgi:hypothetical protein
VSGGSAFDRDLAQSACTGGMTELAAARHASLAYWSRRSVTSGVGTPFCARGTGYQILVYHYSNAALLYMDGGATGPGYGKAGGLALTDGQWRHFLWCYDGTGATDPDRLQLYINGEPRALQFANPDMPTQIVAGASSLCLGTISGATNAYTGDLDEVAVWLATLSGEHAAWLYNGGQGRAYSALRSRTPLAVLSGGQLGIG